MPRLPLALLAALLAGSGLAGCGSAQTRQDPADRAATLLANLRHEFPQIGDAEASVDSLRPSPIEGLDQGVLTVEGDAQPFYVTRDGAQLILLAAPPIDASRTPEQLAAATAAREDAASAEARARGADLARATAGLPARGPAGAPVTIVEFSDFQCPYCRLAAATVEQVLARYPDDVRLVYAHFPLAGHAWAPPAAAAATCAARQDPDAFWTLHDAYFADQQAITPATVASRSRAALAGTGLDLDAWAACSASPEADREVREQVALGERYEVRGTPAFFVNGRFIDGNQPIEAFVAAVEAAKGDR